jgi:putative oxidoreductase
MFSENNTGKAAALLRVTSGGFLLAHGLIKLLVFTPGGTVAFFESIGFPGFLAYPVMAGEIVLGIAMVIGFRTRLAALAAVPIMIGATVPHAGNGFLFSSPNGGWEFPVFWTLVLIVVALLGGGGWAVDGAGPETK